MSAVREYEAFYVVHPHLDDDGIKLANNSFAEMVKKLGGSVSKSEKFGRRRLAFPVNKIKDGNYVTSTFSLPSDQVEELKHSIKFSEKIIRYIISRK